MSINEKNLGWEKYRVKCFTPGNESRAARLGSMGIMVAIYRRGNVVSVSSSSIKIKKNAYNGYHEYHSLEEKGLILVSITERWLPMDTTSRFFEFGLHLDSRDGVL